LAPSPAPTRHNFSKNRSAQVGGEISIAIGESGGAGVTFGGIKQGGVVLLLPPQQIRARHGWGTFSPTRHGLGSCNRCACRCGPRWSGTGSAAAVGGEGRAGRRRTRDRSTAMLQWRRRRARVAESERTGLGIGIWKERFCAIDSPS
jgi:hypothetical protein